MDGKVDRLSGAPEWRQQVGMAAYVHACLDTRPFRLEWEEE